jgi:hypothetical protein
VIALPGLTPTSPVIVVGPVLVTVEAPSTAKLDAAPRFGIWALADLWKLANATIARSIA